MSCGNLQRQEPVDEACGEVEACDPLERSGDEHRDGGEQRVHHVQREGGEHEGELQRLGDTGEERGERTGEHQGSGGLLVLGLGVLVDRECTGRQAEHHDREEAGLVDAGDVHAERVEAAGGDDRATGRVGAAPELADVIDVGKVEPEHVVQCVVQTGRDKQTVEEGVNAGTDGAEAMMDSPNQTSAP